MNAANRLLAAQRPQALRARMHSLTVWMTQDFDTAC